MNGNTRKRKGPSQQLNILHAVTNSQINCNGIKRLSQIHSISIEIIDNFDKRFSHNGIPQLIGELDNLLFTSPRASQRIYEVIKQLYTRMVNFEARRNNDRTENTPYDVYARLVIEYGGVDIIMRYIMQNSERQKTFNDIVDTDQELRTKSICFELLSRLMSIRPEGEDLSKELGNRTECFNYIFSLFVNNKTCHTAGQFIEDVLQFKDIFSLSVIENFHELILRMDNQRLANFCRILAIGVSDLDIYENKSSLYAQNKQKRSKGFVNIRDLNQEIVLNTPELLRRLVDIAGERFYVESFVNRIDPTKESIESELDNWLEWIDVEMDTLRNDGDLEYLRNDDFQDFIGGISEPSNVNMPFTLQPGLSVGLDLTLRVQVIYVLGLFLVGKQRKKVQRRLAELSLVPSLCDMFDQFVWKCETSQRQHHYHSNRRHCECSPEVALKIQFLRLIHSFCDHSEYKHLLLSKSELNEIKRINAKADEHLQVENLESINKHLMCKGSKGLLAKIVDVMKKEPTASTFRFWLARAVESYLRGSTSYCDQVFLLRRGLLQHITSNIIEQDVRPKEILQSSFDLLGELCKFNSEAFKAFDKVLSSEEKFQKFLEVINRNLVDSNMFIRSLVLSYEHFSKYEMQYKDEALRESFLLKHISCFQTQVIYLQRLIQIINVKSLTQENISCLNSTLIFLMFANRKEQIPMYLQGLLACKSTPERCIRSHNVLKNLRDLLLFWQDHYLHKDKDCSALEKSSRIEFDYWKHTVHTLVNEDKEARSSIVHHLEEDYERHS